MVQFQFSVICNTNRSKLKKFSYGFLWGLPADPHFARNYGMQESLWLSLKIEWSFPLDRVCPRRWTNVPFHHRKWKIPKIFFSILGRSVSKGRTLLLRVGFTAPSEARAVIETQGSKVPPEDTLLSEMEQKSKGLFFISDVGCDFLSFYTEFL